MKHRMYPEEFGYALLIEFVARSLNPRQTLNPDSKSLYDIIRADGNFEALIELERWLEELPWAIYRVRRVYSSIPWRRIDCLAVGDRYAMSAQLVKMAEDMGKQVDLTVDPDGILRAYVEKRNEMFSCEDLIVACPHVVREKRRKGFNAAWAKAHQLSLF
ncbi:hypothetical protein ACN4EK_10585 [Pantanalinema rosaneae CENA516]|uniref:hypothetical protein n=1 Tax=Pantanalinema rosaneae TaxID=1620701 RepID=UPI003D6DD5B8